MTGISTDILEEAGDWPDVAQIGRTAARAFDMAALYLEIGGIETEVSLVLTDDQHMRVLNRQWRSIDKPTNVLSFPAMPVRPGQKPGPMLGDIVLARETILREAAEQEKDAGEHLTHLLVHGFLHLLGYDHIEDEDAEAMETLETAILSRLGIADPYAGATV